MFRPILFLPLVFGVAACSRNMPPSPAEPVKAEAKGDEEKSSYERYRSGLFLLDTAAADVAEARQSADRAKGLLKGDGKETLLDVLDMLDNSGDNLTEVAIEPPTPREFDHRFEVYDDQRLKAIATANDSLMELKDARGLVEGLAENKAATATLTVTGSRLDDAIEGLADAITTLGGKIEGEEVTEP